MILGVTSGQELFAQVSARLNRPIWRKALREMGLPESQVEEACRRISDHMPSFQENTFPGVLGNVVAGRIANRFDLGGTNCVIDAACASSLAALQLGLAELRAGAADMVLAGGADTFNDIGMYLCFSKTPALSLSGDCRPFSEDADGTMLGEGICLLALKRLADAERDQDRVYAIIKGIGSSSDGRAKSVYAPLPEGQARALRRAYEQADYSADSVELVEAHGTATRAGDLAEFTSLVSFGVAPALFVARHSEPAALIYLAAVLLRLARFQVGAPGDHLVFQGLPSPAAAMLIAGWFLVFPELPVVVVSILLSFVMLSKIGYPDLPKHYLKGIRSRAELLLPLMLLIALGPARALLATFSCYCLLAPWLSGQVGKTRKV